MYVMTVNHPMGHAQEYLFSRDGEKYKTLIGLTPSYFEDLGYEVTSVTFYPPDSVTPFQIMANILSERVLMLHMHCRYKEEAHVLSKFWHLAKRLTYLQSSTFGDELKLDEVVDDLANTSFPAFNKKFSGGGVI